MPATAPVGSAGSRRALWVALAGLVAVAALVAGVLVVRNGTDDAEGRGEVFLEPASFTTDDPFTDSVDLPNAQGSAATTPVIPTTAPARPDAAAATRGVGGAWPGLYGGTRDRATCDADKLISFLESNPAKAKAWAGVLGVSPSDIESYVGTLTPVVLQRDTRVTNHGFRNGVATPSQSILQAGTAVFVDEFGVPRVKCNCGNPLSEPQAVATTPRYTGTKWPTFSPANVIRVTTTVKVSVFILVDVDGGDPFSRPPGTTGADDTEIDTDGLCDLYPSDTSCQGPPETTTTAPGEPTLGTGDVQVTLRWSSKADLDLAVNDPSGGQIDFENPTSASGGSLDVDSNSDCATAGSSGVENVFWPTGAAPEGVYRVTVTYFDVCEGSPMSQPFELTFKADGAEVPLVPASVRRSDDRVTTTFEVPISPGRPSLLGNADRTHLWMQAGTVAAGESASFEGTKGPGYQAPEPEPEPEDPTPEDPAPDAGDTTPAPVQKSCEELYPGPADATNPMRVLCEHQP